MTLYCNGWPAAVDDLAGALTNYGHFTSLQVRGGAVQGLDLHLQRLQEGTAELFGTALDPLQVRAWMHEPLQPVGVDVLVAVAAPVELPAIARRLRTVRYQRELPHVKHVGTFALFQHRREALQTGVDDTLFVGDDGHISEGTTWNIAFASGSTLIWPQAPALRGTHERLLQAGWGDDQQMRPVALAEVEGFDAAIACNAAGIWPIAVIDGVELGNSEALCAKARQVLAEAPWQPLLA
jgi:branched-subunit amino acid aminotransferase/4-amino-4-deoxychorismate lyase